ncbi:MAG TPA: DUF4102 domain-containing protein, partial [Alphaproteobacteria bacterium]|nr:DUF4102 domain-containing protein [Alphaproteobacteria bacterium]
MGRKDNQDLDRLTLFDVASRPWVTIGPYGAFSLNKAREMAQRMRVEVSQGHDPLPKLILSDSTEDFRTASVGSFGL